MDSKTLPAHPSLELYQKQAEDLVNIAESGDLDALRNVLRRIQHDHPQSGNLGNLPPTDAKPTLADAQLVIAREHGFESWPAFANHIEGLNCQTSAVAKFESAVDAVVQGDVVKLEHLLRDNPELIHQRSTFLHHATLLNYVGANGVENYRQKTPPNALQIAETLLRAGADVNASAAIYGSSDTLGLAATSIFPCRAGLQNALIDLLLEHGAKLNQGRLVRACLANGRGAAAEHLAKRGAPLDLEAAAGVGRLDVVKTFFSEDGHLRPTATVEQMQGGFVWACEYGRTDVIGFLLDRGMPVDAMPYQVSGLHWAAYTARLDIVKLLLERKAPLDIRDGRHHGTPLGWALHAWNESAPEAAPTSTPSRQHEVVALLVAAGVSVDSALPSDLRSRELLIEKIRADAHMLAALKW